MLKYGKQYVVNLTKYYLALFDRSVQIVCFLLKHILLFAYNAITGALLKELTESLILTQIKPF